MLQLLGILLYTKQIGKIYKILLTHNRPWTIRELIFFFIVLLVVTIIFSILLKK